MLRTLFPLILMCVVAACDSPNHGQVGVYGSVQHLGEPVSEGRVLFTPIRENDGRAAGARIQQGLYRIPATSGPNLGPYQITITISLPNSERAPAEQESLGPAVKTQDVQKFGFERVLKSESGDMQLDFELSRYQ